MLVIIFGRSRTGSQTAEPAFVVLGARRNVSLCKARFSAPLPPPDNYCTSLKSNSPFKICHWRIEFNTYNASTIAVQTVVEFFVFYFPVLLFCRHFSR